MAGPNPSLPIQELVSACRRGEEWAWEEFIARTQPVVARACLRAARSWGERDPALIEELVQATYTKLVAGRLLADFEPHHPDAIYGFLKLVAARVAHDHCKAARAAKRGGEGREVEFEQAAATVASAAEAPDAGLLLQEIEACLVPHLSRQEVNRDRLIFQLYYRLGLSAAAIASIPCLELSVKGVESVLNRLTRLARSRLTVGERERAAHGDD
ncbi:MAG TPA: sigma-70 family RNA polymerase sigma factor [Terriglobales bacterium]|nr:sigma-70 family RNA polymerase sigma factor [Terriglobales bacterium]